MTWLKKRLAGWRWVAVLALATAVIWLALRGLPDGRLHVYFLDVGQGDAIFVRAPDGRQILVDGGPSPVALLNELGDVMPFWDRNLDLVVLTHPDADHLAGLLPVLERYRVAQVLDTALADTAAEAASWRELLARARVSRTRAQPGMRLPAGDLVITVLHADQGASGSQPADSRPAASAASDSNNSSLVLRLDYGRASVLLTGDAEAAAENEMLASGLPLRADVLKVGHHGSNQSTSAPFVAAVAPQLAVIQVGLANRFGHPHPDVLQRLAGAPVLRTDLHGRIEMVSDGHQWTVRTARPPVDQ